MQVKDVMTTEVISVSPATPISEVAEILHSHGFNGVPVVNDTGHTVGLISERDLFSGQGGLHFPTYIKLLTETKFVYGGNKELPYVAAQITRIKAQDVLSKDVFFANPDMSLEQLAEIFTVKGQNPIPVTDQANRLVGIVSRSDLIKLLSHTPQLKVSPAPARSRAIDEEFKYVSKHLSSRFAFVTKTRANIWITVAITLAVLGFILGIVYAANPDVFGSGSANAEFNSLSPGPSSRIRPGVFR